MKLNMGLDNSMATSVRSGIKLEGSGGTGSQISTITVVTAGGVGQTLVVQPVQQASVVRTSIDQVLKKMCRINGNYKYLCFQNVNSNRQLENAILCGTSPVHDDGSDKSMDDDEHHIDLKDRNASTVTVDNGHYIVAASGNL